MADRTAAHLIHGELAVRPVERQGYVEPVAATISVSGEANTPSVGEALPHAHDPPSSSKS